jgi:DNA-binding NarL/FixJ family response regulator
LHGSSETVHLSQREREVLTLVGQGMTSRAIARKLVISEETVKSHLAAIASKLGTQNRMQSAYLAGCIDATDPRLVRPLKAELTRSQLDVLQLRLRGHEVKEIAAIRGRSTTTVKGQLSEIYLRLDVAGRYNAMLRVIALARLLEAAYPNQGAIARRLRLSKHQADEAIMAMAKNLFSPYQQLTLFAS